jgi:hypothetical protein
MKAALFALVCLGIGQTVLITVPVPELSTKSPTAPQMMYIGHVER